MHIEDVVGRRRCATWRVSPERTVSAAAGDARYLQRYGLPVLASPEFLRLVEDTCWSGMLPLVDTSQGIVGTRFEVSHCAPSAPGDFVEIYVECTAAAVRTATWLGHAVNLRTGQRIGTIEHDAAVVNRDEFLSRVAPQLN